MRESLSGTKSHVHYIWACNEIKASYDKYNVSITIVQSYTQKKYHLFVAVGIVAHATHS